jgi:hypothetical protein
MRLHLQHAQLYCWDQLHGGMQLRPVTVPWLRLCLKLPHTACCACAGWSHFAQFTIAVANKDPKKSKYSGEQQQQQQQ